MQRKSVFRLRLGVGLCSLLGLGFSNLCFAQQPSVPTWVSFMSSRVKPDMRQEFEGYMKEISATYKQGGAPFRAVYQDAFGDLNEYVSVTPIDKFASMDGPSLLVKVMGQESWDRLARAISHCTFESRRWAGLVQNDLSLRKSQQGAYPFGLVSYTVVAPDRLSDYENWLKNDYLPALRKGGVEDYWVNRTIFGGNLYEFNAVRWLKNMADLDSGPILNRAVGPEAAAKITAKTAGMIRSQRLVVIRARPDLSWMGATSQ